MPRIPVRTEPYSDLFRQHRHYKNKRDLIIRSLGKASYINGSQFAIVFISAKGDVEKYASEMVQGELGEVFVDEVVEGLRLRVKETNDRRREQLEVELRLKEEAEIAHALARATAAGQELGADGSHPPSVAGLYIPPTTPLAPSEVLRSAKKRKRDAALLLEARRKEEEEREREEKVQIKRKVSGAGAAATAGPGGRMLGRGRRGKGMVDEDEEGDEEEEEGDSDMEDGEEQEQPSGDRDIKTSVHAVPQLGLLQDTDAPHDDAEEAIAAAGTYLNLDVDDDADTVLKTKSAAKPEAPLERFDLELDLGNDSNTSFDQGDDTLVEVDDRMMVAKIEEATTNGYDLSGRSREGKAGEWTSVDTTTTITPARPHALSMSAPVADSPPLLIPMDHATHENAYHPSNLSFVTPAPARRKHKSRRESLTVGWASDHKDGSNGADGFMSGEGIPSLTFTTPGAGDSTGHRARSHQAQPDTPSHEQAPTHTYVTHPSTSTSTATLTIPSESLSSYYLQKFNELQQTTCKLVVKTWIKVIEPKKQSKFPYNRGEEGRPDWWPEGIRHKEPDHLMKPERTELLLAIIRSPAVKVVKLEIATAEASAYITQGKMKILREIYRVAKEEERRRHTMESTADIVIQAPSSPTMAPKLELDETSPAAEREAHLPLMTTPLLSTSTRTTTTTMVIPSTSAFAAQAIIASTPSRAPASTSHSGSYPRGRKRQRESEADKENRVGLGSNIFVGHADSSSRELGPVPSELVLLPQPTTSANQLQPQPQSRRPRTEPRTKKPRSMATLDQVASSGVAVRHGHGHGGHLQSQEVRYRAAPHDTFAGPFSSTPLHHQAKWHGGMPHTAPRQGQGMMLPTNGMMMSHGHPLHQHPHHQQQQEQQQHHHSMEMGLGVPVRGGQAHSMGSMSRSPALTADEASRPGSSHSYMAAPAYQMESTPSRAGMHGIPHHMAMTPYAYAPSPGAYYQDSYVQRDQATEYATAATPQSASMASIQPTYYTLPGNAPPPIGYVTSEPPVPVSSAFRDAMAGGQHYEMGEYVASSGYSVQNPGEFPFVAQS